MLARLGWIALLVAAGCSFTAQPAEIETSADGCAPFGGPWTLSSEAMWVRQITEAGGYRVIAETGSAFVAAGKGHRFSIWASEGRTRRMPNTRRLARVRGVPVFGEGKWRYWNAQAFTFWVHGERPPAAGRLAPVVDASLRMPFRERCTA